MAGLGPRERRQFNLNPIDSVDYHLDIDYVGDRLRAHRLDVLTPRTSATSLPVYIYFHGGGWTSGDKATLTKYCASQSSDGMVVVNVNYRMATAFRMHHILHDASAALDWVTHHIAEFGGDPTRIVLGGDSAGGQIAALLTAAVRQPEFARHHELVTSVERSSLRGLVQHCSIVDFSVIFEPGFILSLNFIRMLVPSTSGLLPARRKPRMLARSQALVRAARFLSPIEWIDPGFPPVFVSTSERDYFYRANLNFIRALRRKAIPVDTVILHRRDANATHTWQQDPRHPESQAVYRGLQAFVRRVTAPPLASAVTH